MSPTQSPTVTIAPGVQMPLVGLGTWEATGAEAYAAVRSALEVGYRHIDTATMYRNEDAVGRAVRESGISREDIFVTTKMLATEAGRERNAIDSSLRAMGLDHVDLWLVHWPPDDQARPDIWTQFVDAREQGLTRAIGVSNYTPVQIDQLIDVTGVAPAVNQIRWAPDLYDAAVVRAHRDRGVILEGWRPFKTTDLENPVLVEIAGRHGVTTRQVVLRWHVDHGIVVIPKSSNSERIAENFGIFGFSLSGGELARIDGLGHRSESQILD